MRTEGQEQFILVAHDVAVMAWAVPHTGRDRRHGPTTGLGAGHVHSRGVEEVYLGVAALVRAESLLWLKKPAAATPVAYRTRIERPGGWLAG
jgi:hypothetical protein